MTDSEPESRTIDSQYLYQLKSNQILKKFSENICSKSDQLIVGSLGLVKRKLKFQEENIVLKFLSHLRSVYVVGERELIY